MSDETIMSDEIIMSNETVNEMAARLFGVLDQHSKALGKVQKALKNLMGEGTLESPRKVEEASKQLEAFDPTTLGPDIDFGGLLSLTMEDQKNRAARRKIEFGRTLKEIAAHESLRCGMITTDPMEFFLPPFTVSVNLEKNLAALHYARLMVEELPAKPDKIMAALQKNLKLMDAGWPAEDFFDALYHAYEIELFEKKGHPGERVTLINLLSFVALSFQNKPFRLDPVEGHYRAYGRVRMAYDLAGLRRNGLLERNGRRLNLGTATGTATRNKKNVLYVEEGDGRGQYYLSAWFSPTPGEDRQ